MNKRTFLHSIAFKNNYRGTNEKIINLFLVVGLLISVIGCGGAGDDDDEETTGSLKIVNNSASAISVVAYSLHTDTTYGSNRISTPIAVGSTYTLTGITPDTYDIIVQNATLQWETVDIPAYVDGVTFAAGQTRIFTFTGSTGMLASIKNSDKTNDLVTEKVNIENSSDESSFVTDESTIENSIEGIVKESTDSNDSQDINK